jgi:hypothetical protein
MVKTKFGDYVSDCHFDENKLHFHEMMMSTLYKTNTLRGAITAMIIGFTTTNAYHH